MASRARITELASAESRIRVRETLGRRGSARLTVATGVIVCLGLAVFAETPTGTAEATATIDPVAVQQRALADQAASRATRSADEAKTAESAPQDEAGTATAEPVPPAEPVAPAEPEPPAEPAPPVDPGPVAGLSLAQMNNAKAIVRTGRDMGMPRRALVIAVATAMQESNLLNLASGVLPESMNYPNQGVGWDHDSVGLFQQRSSTGWGPVGKLMDPAYATTRFLEALMQVPGWQWMRLTEAAQAVQVSAFPEHYAKHEGRATIVVDAIVPGWK
ncbi:peptidase M23 [Micromonospora sonneratiae]